MHTKAIRNIALLRAICITAGVIVVVAGVTFAALQSQAAVLRGNTIQTATADLKLSSDGTQFSSQLDGYVFGSLIPGGRPMPISGYPVKLKNMGSTPLAVSLSLAGPIANPDNVDLSKVRVILTPTVTGSPLDVSLQALLTAHDTGGLPVSEATRLVSGQMVSYTIQIAMDAGAVSGPSANLSDIHFNFNAVAIN